MSIDLSGVPQVAILLTAQFYSASYGAFTASGAIVNWETGQPTEEDARAKALELYKSYSLEIINNLAEIARNKFVTVGSAKAMTYIEKGLEAEKAILEENPSVEDYRLLASDIGTAQEFGFGTTVKAVAQVVIATKAAWKEKEYAINIALRNYKGQLRDAENFAQLDAIIANVNFNDL